MQSKPTRKEVMFERAKKMASERNFKLLSTTYTNNHTKMKWRCLAKNHEWEATYNGIQRGSGCPYCWGKNFKHSHGYIQKEIEKMGFELLSKKYKSINQKLEVKCKKGHIWNPTFKNLRNGHGCPVCSGRKVEMDVILYFCKEKGIECLSEKYTDNKTPLKWKCSKGHIWESTFYSIRYFKKHFCKICKKERKTTIEKVKKIAEEKGGKCLSGKIEKCDSKLKFECCNGHTWEALGSTIKRNWCPYCANLLSLSELKCKYILEQITGLKFHKTRNELNGRLELDGYNPEHKLAFEYNGKQHYHKDSFYNKKSERFYKTIENDSKKRSICKQKGIKLLTIPYTANSNDENLIKFITDKCKKIFGEEHVKDVDVNLKIKNFVTDISELNKIKNIAIKRKGKCLSKYYLGSNVKMEFECKKGHKWLASPDKIKQNKWCPHCSKKITGKKVAEIRKEKKNYKKAWTPEKIANFSKERGGGVFYGKELKDTKNENIIKFPSIRQAERDLKIDRSQISGVLNGKYKKAKGWVFSRENFK